MVGGSGEPSVDDAWRDVTATFAAVGTALRDHFSDRPEVLADVRAAMAELGVTASRLAGVTADALRDGGLRDKLQTALAALLVAVRQTATDIHIDLERDRRGENPGEAAGDGSPPAADDAA